MPLTRNPPRVGIKGMTSDVISSVFNNAALVVEATPFTFHALLSRSGRIQAYQDGTGTNMGFFGNYLFGPPPSGWALTLGGTSFQFVVETVAGTSATASVVWPQNEVCLLSLVFNTGVNAMQAFLNGILVANTTALGAVAPGATFSFGSGAGPGVGLGSDYTAGARHVTCYAAVTGPVAQTIPQVVAFSQEVSRALRAGQYIDTATAFPTATHYWDTTQVARFATPTQAQLIDRIAGAPGLLIRTLRGASSLDAAPLAQLQL